MSLVSLWKPLVAFACVVASAAAATPPAHAEPWEPPAVYLTWQRDPTTTMTVHWHAWPDRPRSVVSYQRADRPNDAWSAAEGASVPMPGSERLIHTVELTGLEPDTAYAFRAGVGAREFTFRTLPAGPSRPIRFVASGCVYKAPEVFTRLADRLAVRDPDFALLAGDIAYADASLDKAHMWIDFLGHWKDRMVTPDGHLVPMIWTIGNHEVVDGYGEDKGAAVFFYEMAAFPPRETGYGVIDVADYLSIVLLDSGHTTAVAGPQTDWLDATLAARRHVPHLFAAYHVPAYPSARRYDGALSARVRRHWVPLFDEHRVDVVFEAHDHAYKRTHPLRGGEVDEFGTVYFGDGGWSTAGTREPAAPGERWYLAATAAANHATFVTLDGDLRTFEPIDVHGNALEPPYRMTAGVPSAIIKTGGAGPGLPWWLWVVIAGAAAGGAAFALVVVRQRATKLMREVGL